MRRPLLPTLCLAVLVAMSGAAHAGAQEAPPQSEPGDTSEGIVVADATDEQLEAARELVAARVRDAGNQAAEARKVQREALAELVALRARIETAAAAQLDARQTADAAKRKADALAAERDDAVERRAATRDLLAEAAVDAYINPPQRDGLRAAALGDPNDAVAASGLLAGRVAKRHGTLEEHQRAERSARRAEAAAQRALSVATDAADAADDAVEELQATQRGEANQVAETEAAIAAITGELGELATLDRELAAELAARRLITSGSVTVTIGADGTWSVAATGLPGGAEMLQVPGTTIRVHTSFATQVTAAVNAARADGVTLDGWGWRDSETQISLRRQHCGDSVDAVFNTPSNQCRPPTARPGHSMHERGLAVDFKNCSTRATVCYQWLAANGARFGLINLPSEPWHWSVNGN